MVYKMSATLQVEVTRSIPPSSRELLEHSTHPIVILFFFNITLMYVGLLSPRTGVNQDISLCASCSRDHLRTENYVILTTLLFADAENTNM
jgi:hypothetical protein